MKCLLVICIVIAVLLLICLLICIALQCRRRWAYKKVNCLCFDKKVRRLDDSLSPFGFRYQRQGDLIVSTMHPWQRDMGYCRKYDAYAPSMNMIFDSEPVYFDYDGKRWLLEFWKGQYGIATGGEIGLYVNRNAQYWEPPDKLFYDCARDDERIHMQFRLSKAGRIIMQRWSEHWWLTGFRAGEYSKPEELVMQAMVGFPNEEMRSTFYNGLLQAGYKPSEIHVEECRVCICFDRPHTHQPERYRKCYLHHICKKNKRACQRYLRFTRCFICSLDKINFIGYYFPHLYQPIMQVGRKLRRSKLLRWKRNMVKIMYDRREKPRV